MLNIKTVNKTNQSFNQSIKILYSAFQDQGPSQNTGLHSRQEAQMKKGTDKRIINWPRSYYKEKAI